MEYKNNGARYTNAANVPADLANIWNNALKLLEEDISEAPFDTMIVPLVPLYVKNGVFSLKAPDSFIKDTVKIRYGKKIEDRLLAAAGAALKIEILTDEDLNPGSGAFHRGAPSMSINLNSKYVFEAFVKGKSNELAFEASVAVADNPGQTLFNPLFIYGSVGLGKTHLMHSIANRSNRKNPKKVIVYISTENFTNEFIYSLRENKTLEFRNKFRNVDILLLDDIQFLAKKMDTTQEELFHTFNTLYNANKQIVISSDLPPKELKSIEDRLTSRFGSGLIVDISPPDYETRMAIIEKKAELEQMRVPTDVTEYIALNVTENIRDIEGAINKIIAVSKLNNTQITLVMAERVLKEFVIGSEKREITAPLIQQAVAGYFDVPIGDMLSNSRVGKLTQPRHIAMYLCKKLLVGVSITKLGDYFNRDHTTIMHGADSIAEKIEKDAYLNDKVVSIEKQIKSGG